MLTIRLPRPVDIEHDITVFESITESPEKLSRRRPEEVVMWRCTECGMLHDDEDDADECCLDDGEGVGMGGMLLETGAVRCPCCGSPNEDVEGAVDCCMWKTHSPAERFNLAQQLRAYGYLLDSAMVGIVTEGVMN